ncbi:MAG TPA: hypothetical protein VGD81_03715 [Opitutaceae bacterium]
MIPFPHLHFPAVTTEPAPSFASRQGFGSGGSSAGASPSAHEPLPAPGSEPWTVWNDAVLDEARQSTGVISSRHWKVVHPDDSRMLALLADMDAGNWDRQGVDVPRQLHWLSRLDGRAYTLVEFLSLSRQPASPPGATAPRPQQAFP